MCLNRDCMPIGVAAKPNVRIDKIVIVHETDGIHARAELSYDIGHGDRRIQRMESAGLWGIESDSGADYLKEVEQEELADLRRHLEVFGVDCSNWEELVAKAEHKDEDGDSRAGYIEDGYDEDGERRDE